MRRRVLGGTAAGAAVVAAALLGPAAPAQAATDRPFSHTCIATSSNGAIYAGSITMTGTWHAVNGRVYLRKADVRANGRMFTITSNRLWDEFSETVEGFGYTGVLSAGESFPGTWSPPDSVLQGWGLWR